ncbi:MAG: Ribonuclease P protein component [Candidatus Falkowbacteria bacterium GW2011_GWC2_38_22]|uniref:Ribonuclease P protein component n=1 Tax=Candidatus Falkowbacteria bacterium GW2011_GWE1_38_31 TaxID=1618638 RepID=A0A0G0JP82_9BACT|nr:MAG: Ribonuclease P protein component [Candidatus Falkowbacteria bacterium GW2011_GWF2_38_1205]KKQ60417.1 MAG: Ribonuclease P protein component [Candidatus Falkowbacteria bacterium GW2011_GWC2_38_22]KKQ62464.1 MAG: Ribonuclease P protein component [Candidatus Falkowbacteria bacterium GW2011_GWF1_38_22]KKQ64535.1 MAG: Ribonuclease P protein component [Candidatus Falkowbacteria bacterium GW2011_GWE2_38_254]KKQ69373.1 MAG: Ribonuclease P protein component [Candidatus Falkowbacteria bacterium GW
MLPKKNRLTKKNDFDRVFKKGISVFDYILGIKILKNNLPDSRFGIIVSNKISKKANERNKIKRQIRECLKKINPKIILPIDCVIITLAPIKNSKFIEMEKTIKVVFNRLNNKIKIQ